MNLRRWLPLILLGIGLMLAQVAGAVGRQLGGDLLVYAPALALGIAMIPWALGNEKLGRTAALLAAAITLALSILFGMAAYGWMFVPSGVLAAIVGWIGIQRERKGSV